MKKEVNLVLNLPTTHFDWNLLFSWSKINILTTFKHYLRIFEVKMFQFYYYFGFFFKEKIAKLKNAQHSYCILPPLALMKYMHIAHMLPEDKIQPENNPARK